MKDTQNFGYLLIWTSRPQIRERLLQLCWPIQLHSGQGSVLAESWRSVAGSENLEKSWVKKRLVVVVKTRSGCNPGDSQTLGKGGELM